MSKQTEVLAGYSTLTVNIGDISRDAIYLSILNPGRFGIWITNIEVKGDEQTFAIWAFKLANPTLSSKWNVDLKPIDDGNRFRNPVLIKGTSMDATPNAAEIEIVWPNYNIQPTTFDKVKQFEISITYRHEGTNKIHKDTIIYQNRD